MQFSTLYALFILYTCFSYSCLTISQTSKHLFYILFIFPMNDAFFSFIQKFIQFYKENYSLKKIFIKKNMKLFIQGNYSFIWKMNYRPGLRTDKLNFNLLTRPFRQGWGEWKLRPRHDCLADILKWYAGWRTLIRSTQIDRSQPESWHQQAAHAGNNIVNHYSSNKLLVLLQIISRLVNHLLVA